MLGWCCYTFVLPIYLFTCPVVHNVRNKRLGLCFSYTPFVRVDAVVFVVITYNYARSIFFRISASLRRSHEQIKPTTRDTYHSYTHIQNNTDVSSGQVIWANEKRWAKKNVRSNRIIINWAYLFIYADFLYPDVNKILSTFFYFPCDARKKCTPKTVIARCGVMKNGSSGIKLKNIFLLSFIISGCYGETSFILRTSVCDLRE